MKTLLLISAILIAVTVFGISKSYAQYGEGFSPVQHYPPTNDTKLQLIVMNSTEFKERTTGYNYAFAGIDYNWVSKGNNNYDFGGARVTFLVAGFENGTTKGEAFNLDSQMNVKSVFEYDADRPPAGYRSDTCYGCLLSNASQTDVDKFHIGHVADDTYNETAALQRSTQLMNMQNDKMAEKQNLEVQLATKQHDYDDAVKNSNATKISSLLGDINEIKNQTSSLQEQIDKITQELNVIQEANIQFYYMDPVLLKKYQAASDGFATKIQVQYWKGKSFDEQKNAFPLVGIGVDSKKKSVEITLWKGIENSTNVDRYISVIKELMPSDVPWHVSFGEYPTAYYSTLTMHPLQQVNSGILAKDVQCNQGFQLIFKTEDGSPACVKPDTASKLVELGWAKEIVPTPVTTTSNMKPTIQNYTGYQSKIIPGQLVLSSCGGGRDVYHSFSNILNSTGFHVFYNITNSGTGFDDDYVIEPGHVGTITYVINAGSSPTPYMTNSYFQKELNITNYAVFYHYVTDYEELLHNPSVTIHNGDYESCFKRPNGSCAGLSGSITGPIRASVVDHPGVNVSFDPASELLQYNDTSQGKSSQIITMTVSVDYNSPQGTYWVVLSPEECLGGKIFLLTMGNEQYNELNK
jgi:hypothetical protein